MASRQQIKKRIGSVKSTRQITRAMQLVAASKLRRAQEAAAGPAEYSRMARELLTRLRHIAQDDSEFRLFTPRPVKRRLLIVITSDRSLAGAYNANIIRQMVAELKTDRDKSIKTSVICIGRQAAHAASRIAELEIEAIYQDLPDHPDANTLRPVLSSAVGLFVDRRIDAVDVMYTHFISTIKQAVLVQSLLPAGFAEIEGPVEFESAEIEPSPEELLRSATLRLLDVQLYQAVLEAFASEHSMRMLAMKNATDNAGELIDAYTLEYNTARQAAITQELAEITGGASAING